MSVFVLYFVVLLVVIVAFTLATATVKILRQYERAVVFTLGRFQKVKGPGLVLLIPFFQEMVPRRSAHPGHRDTDPGRDLTRQRLDEG